MKKLFLCAIVMLGCSACMNLDFGQKIEYRIVGGHFAYKFKTPDGQFVTSTSYAEVDTVFIAHFGDRIYVKANDIGGTGGLAIIISRDGIPWKKNGTNAYFDSVEVDVKLPFKF